MPLNKLISRCEEAKGFKRYGAAFLLGALMTLTTAPIGAFPLLLACVPGLIVLSREATKRQAFFTGWAFGAGYFIFGLYWVSAALFVDIKQWGWVLPLSAVVGPSVLGLFYGFIPLLARRWRGDLAAYALAIVAAWSGIEWLRGHVLTGFPWNLPGYSWHWALPVMQAASVAGAYGLTLLTLFWAALPVLASRRRLLYAGIASFAIVCALGAARLAGNPTEQNGHYTVRLVQANIPQQTKWDNNEDFRNLQKHIALTHEKSALPDPLTFVVWPETSVLADLKQFPEIAHLIALGMPKGATGIFGALRVLDAMASRPSFYNSVTVFGPDEKVVANYDKHHLVPFGEYIPFRDLIKFRPLALAVAGIGDFTRGPGPQTIHDGKLPSFSPLICYEAIFPGEVADEKDRPDWLVNVTNDGWYGRTAGPHQHLESARMRAVEEGLPLARAANTGISAVFDPLGRELGSQALLTSGYVDTILPKPLPPTVYSQAGDSIFLALLAFVMIGAEVLRRRPATFA